MKIDLSIYKERRAKLLSELPDNSVMIVAAASLVSRNADAEYPFRQSSDFYYLTGFNEPDGLLLLKPGSDQSVVLFCQPRDPEMEIWTGYRAGPEGCIETYGADAAYNLSEIDQQIPSLIDGVDQLFYPLARDAALDSRVKGWIQDLAKRVRAGAEVPKALSDSDPILHEMRLFKSDAEIAIMQRAADISAQAHVKAMQKCAIGMNEFQLEAIIQSHCMAEGARFQAYTPIVAAGRNACILHYIDNDQSIHDGDLILIDAGCELDNYASDITRTFPANGQFSHEQQAIYQLVLNANKACIAAVKPGCNWDALHQLSVTILTEGLVELGLLSGEVDQLIESGAFRRFYMHRVGHWLGMDVHDVGSYRVEGEWRELAPGIVTTIEPGLYIAPDDHSVEERWRGIGVRIEDDVLVTEDGARVLTSAVPKEIDEIEALMRRA